MAFENPSVGFVQQYGQNVQMLAQQTVSKLYGLVNRETVTGKRHYFDTYGEHDAMRNADIRFQPLVNTDTKHGRRAVDLKDFYDSKLVDSFDKLKTLIDPNGAISRAQAAQIGRQIDDVLIEGFFADAKTGETGSTTLALPSSQVVAVNSHTFGSGSGNANMTISKMIEAAEQMNSDNVPEEGRYLVLDTLNHAKLLQLAETTSIDFATTRNLQTGKIEGMLGFMFIQSTRLPVDGSGHRRCFAFQRDALAVAVGQDPMYDVSIRKDIVSMPWQAYISMSMAATRIDDKGFVEIKCLAT